MNLIKIKNLLLSINHARKVVGVGFFAEAVRSNLRLEIVKDFPKCKVLILSPHPDDDVFGCGGTIKMLSDIGSEIKVIYLANGSGGKTTNKNETELIATRREEAKSAASIIGIGAFDFWEIDDGKLTADKSSARKLESMISDFKPDIIFSPAIIDPHPDHFETAKILAMALKISKLEPEIWQYEIWQPLFANRLVKIDSTFEAKKSAAMAHSSQIGCRNYIEAISGLNKYRAGMFNAGQYAEAFFASNKKIYLKLFETTTKSKFLSSNP